MQIFINPTYADIYLSNIRRYLFIQHMQIFIYPTCCYLFIQYVGIYLSNIIMHLFIYIQQVVIYSSIIQIFINLTGSYLFIQKEVMNHHSLFI